MSRHTRLKFCCCKHSAQIFGYVGKKLLQDFSQALSQDVTTAIRMVETKCSFKWAVQISSQKS